jgi:hypothetical protein
VVRRLAGPYDLHSINLPDAEFEGAEAAGAVSAEHAAGVGVVLEPGSAEHADDQVVYGSHQAWCAPGADTAGIFAVRESLRRQARCILANAVRFRTLPYSFRVILGS